VLQVFNKIFKDRFGIPGIFGFAVVKIGQVKPGKLEHDRLLCMDRSSTEF
jgi:hypothetical protein